MLNSAGELPSKVCCGAETHLLNKFEVTCRRIFWFKDDDVEIVCHFFLNRSRSKRSSLLVKYQYDGRLHSPISEMNTLVSKMHTFLQLLSHAAKRGGLKIG